jgi:two-component system, NtrC family, response regulator AtoC
MLSQADVPVLITGEAGSGKATTARLIHVRSLRSSFPFRSVDCQALTADLLESELFGSEHIGVSGQTECALGKFEQCARGTVLLQCFNAMPEPLQERLSKLLQTHHIVRCGGGRQIRIDVRIIAATEGDLDREVAENVFNQDLYQRLSVFHLQVPPLRERREEIPLLLGHFMNQLTRRYGVPAPRFSSVLLEACQHYSWPGNLRELDNFAKRFLALGDEQAALEELQSHRDLEATKEIANGERPERIWPNVSASEEQSSLKSLVRNAKGEAERSAIARALEQTNWNRKAAARLLNISYRGLLYKIQEYHLAPPAWQSR